MVQYISQFTTEPRLSVLVPKFKKALFYGIWFDRILAAATAGSLTDSEARERPVTYCVSRALIVCAAARFSV